MFFPEGRIRIFVWGQPVDMRKSFTGLYALVKHVLKEDALSGSLFFFINRRGSYIKSLYWDRTGFCIWAKRLERGRFRLPCKSQHKMELSYTELKLLLEGIELNNTHRRRRFKLTGSETVTEVGRVV